MPTFLLTVAVAALGGFIGRKLRLPAGTIIGAMIAVLVMNILWDCANVPDPFRPYIRIMAGVYIGTRMSAKDVLSLRSILPATIMMVFGLIFLNLCVGIGISAPASSWGTLANEARGLIESNPIQIIWPVGAICLTMLSLNFIGDGVGEALDPKKK